MTVTTILDDGSAIYLFPNIAVNRVKSLKGEIWNQVPKYEGIYYASSMGRVKSVLAIAIFNGVVTKIFEKLLPFYPNRSTGYVSSRFYKNGRWVSDTMHRLIASTFIPNPLNKPQVNHKNGNKGDNRLENLEWATASENTTHGYDNELNSNCGETHYLSKLTHKEVACIRSEYKAGSFDIYEIAKSYKVNRTTIYDIINNKTWRRNVNNL